MSPSDETPPRAWTPGTSGEDGSASTLSPSVTDHAIQSASASFVELTEESKESKTRDNETNIKVMMWYTAFNAIAQAIAQGPVLDKFLYDLGGHQNSFVGIGNSIWGITSLVVALPIGYLVDTYSRTMLLKVGAVFGVVASLLMILAVLAGSIWMLYVGFVAWGLYFELGASASEAVFADSVPQGSRSKLFTRKATVLTVSMGIGPMLTLLGLVAVGGDWTMPVMETILIAGNLMLLPACILMWFFKTPSVVSVDGEDEAESTLVHSTPARCGGCLKPTAVPYIVAMSDFITSMGAGMTVKFFNLFFIQDYGFSNLGINALLAVYPLAIALMMQVLRKVSKYTGRAQASWISFLLNACCFLAFWKVHNLPLLLCIFLLRGALANATYPIDRSIVMDFVPSSQRGKWNAVESFSSMTWCGSAFIGGYLADSHDYRYTFLITAFLYFFSSAFYSPLLWLVPRKEAQGRRAVLPVGSPGMRSPLIGVRAAAAMTGPGLGEREGAAASSNDLGVSLQQF